MARLSASTAEKTTTNFHQVAQAHLAIPVLVQQRAEQTAAQATLLLHARLFLSQHLAQAVGIQATGAGALRQKRHHDRRQYLQQLTGIGAQTRGLAQASFSLLLLATKNMAQDGGPIGCRTGARRTAATEQTTQQTAQAPQPGSRTALVLLQCAKQIHRTLGLRRIASQRAQQQRQGGADGALGLGGIGAQLLRHLLQRRALQLGHQLIDKRVGSGHGTVFQKIRSGQWYAQRGCSATKLRRARLARQCRLLLQPTQSSNPMGIRQYLKDIARGKDGARALTRDQAADLMGQVLDGTASDLEVGAFCVAMRIKGETAQEMAGFLDAVHARLELMPASTRPLIVLPSYNGARKLPVLTPLLALLLAQRGCPVLVHGNSTEDRRASSQEVLAALGINALTELDEVEPGQVAFAPTALLLPGLARLLDVRRTLGLRNSAHSLVKLMDPLSPVAGDSLIVSSYTHPEYAISMAATFEHVQANALLLRGTEGEVVADARRAPQMQGFIQGQRVLLQEGVKGTLPSVPDLPKAIDAVSTAAYIESVLAGASPVPATIAQQVTHIVELVKQL